MVVLVFLPLGFHVISGTTTAPMLLLLLLLSHLSRVRLCDAMDCNLPGSSVHEILQARILEWVAISFSKGSS